MAVTTINSNKRICLFLSFKFHYFFFQFAFDAWLYSSPITKTRSQDAWHIMYRVPRVGTWPSHPRWRWSDLNKCPKSVFKALFVSLESSLFRLAITKEAPTNLDPILSFTSSLLSHFQRPRNHSHSLACFS